MSDILDLEVWIKRKRISDCTHAAADVDEAAASLTCQFCGVELDPWWFLRKMARDLSVAKFTLHQANKEAKRLAEEIDELTRQRNNLRAQIRRAER